MSGRSWRPPPQPFPFLTETASKLTRAAGAVRDQAETVSSTGPQPPAAGGPDCRAYWLRAWPGEPLIFGVWRGRACSGEARGARLIEVSAEASDTLLPIVYHHSA